MGMKNYTDKENKTLINRVIKASDPFFNFFVYLEFVFKVIAMGFSGEFSYLSDSWNWLDFFVVLASMVNDLLPLLMPGNQGAAGLKALRSVRLLRPLKLLRTIPAIRILITTVLSSIQSLSGIIGLAMFFFMIFSILGVTIWNGKIHYRCYLTEEPVFGEWEVDPRYDKLCMHDDQCPEGSFCRS